ncbi:hypothetical protein L2U69_12260 [Zavarzinia compransoris]|uniref:hypothetical protein n=1 Tax=Zavarzinia marina TaxID=2911065 RepID=UPI001F2F657E|nr:hypothetical protein [Zavarzinia marina]MCF4166418.1 hypothetical protein [Zavarzinia marina]
MTARDITAPAAAERQAGVRVLNHLEVQFAAGGVRLVLGFLLFLAGMGFLAWQRWEALVIGWAKLAAGVPPTLWAGLALLPVAVLLLMFRHRAYRPGRSFRAWRTSGERIRLIAAVAIGLGLIGGVAAAGAGLLLDDRRYFIGAGAGLAVVLFTFLWARRRVADAAPDPVAVDLMAARGVLKGRAVTATFVTRAKIDGRHGEAVVALADDGYAVALGNGPTMTGTFHGFDQIAALGIGESGRRQGVRAMVVRFHDGGRHVFLFDPWRLKTTALVVAARAFLGAFDRWLEGTTDRP